MIDWHSVNDELPLQRERGYSDRVLVVDDYSEFGGGKTIEVDRLVPSGQWERYCSITHWAKLPGFPSKEGLTAGRTEQALDLIVDTLEAMDDDARQEAVYTVRQLFCMFCGKRHPKGRMCHCWKGCEALCAQRSF